MYDLSYLIRYWSYEFERGPVVRTSSMDVRSRPAYARPSDHPTIRSSDDATRPVSETRMGPIFRSVHLLLDHFTRILSFLELLGSR